MQGTADLIQCSSGEHLEPHLTAGPSFFLHLDLSDHAKLVRTKCASPGFDPERRVMELRHASMRVKTE